MQNAPVSAWLEWTLVAVAAVFALAGFALVFFGLWYDRSRRRPRCPKCWYDMRGLSVSDDSGTIACPECGRETNNERHLYRTRRRWGRAMVGGLLIIIGCYGETVRYRVLNLKEDWRTATVPTVALIPMCEPSNWAYPTFEARYFRGNRDSPILPRRQRWFFHDYLLTQKARSWLDLGESPLDERAVKLLGYAGETFDGALDTLDEVMTHRNGFLRLRACQAFGHAGNVKYLPSLVKALDDPYGMVPRAAVHAIGLLGRAQFKGMTDRQLMDVFDRINSDDFPQDGTTRDLYLNEMIRRGGSSWERYLVEKSISPPPDRSSPGVKRNLEIGTALRRIQGWPDPLRIVVKTELKESYPPKQLPKLKVRIENVDKFGVTVGFTKGGLYRGKRQDQWRIDASDSTGKAMPLTKVSKMDGIQLRNNLKKGDGWETTLDMNAFVGTLSPGDYAVVIRYHDAQGISNERDLSNLILSKSESFKLRVSDE